MTCSTNQYLSRAFIGGKGIQRSCHCPLLEKCLDVCGPSQDMTKLIECIPLGTGVSEVLLAAPEVPHREV